MGHLLLHSLGWFVAVAWPQEPYGGIVDGLRCLRGELLARESRALASAVASAATDLLFLAALCTVRVRAVRSAVQRSPSPLLGWRALACPAPTVPARWPVHGEARGEPWLPRTPVPVRRAVRGEVNSKLTAGNGK